MLPSLGGWAVHLGNVGNKPSMVEPSKPPAYVGSVNQLEFSKGSLSKCHQPTNSQPSDHRPLASKQMVPTSMLAPKSAEAKLEVDLVARKEMPLKVYLIHRMFRQR